MAELREFNHSVDEYYNAILGLLPKGPAWQIDNSFLDKIMYLTAQELQRVEHDIYILVQESDARTASVTLDDWFEEWDIPDACAKQYASDDLLKLRDLLVLKISTLGYTFPDLVQIIANYIGVKDATIEAPYIYDVTNTVDKSVYGDHWRNAIYVRSSGDVGEVFTTNSRVNEFLATWGNDLWECLIKAIAPAHCDVIFQYGD